MSYFGYLRYITDHALIPEVKRSSEIPEVVKSQRDFNLYLHEKDLSHCSILDPTDLKLETTLEHCLLAYTGLDTLDENNKFICHRCSYPDGKYVCVCYTMCYKFLLHLHAYIATYIHNYIVLAIFDYVYIHLGRSDVVPRCVSKQILIHKLSPVLILHIKRFIIGSHRVTKDNHQVSFPRVLDMSPFCTVECVEVRLVNCVCVCKFVCVCVCV